jgi:hypothetical protein
MLRAIVIALLVALLPSHARAQERIVKAGLPKVLADRLEAGI